MEEKKKEDIIFSSETDEKVLWYFRPWVVVLAIIGLGPLGLPLLWFRPKTKMCFKILVSVLVIVLTVWMSFGVAKYYQELMLHYKELAEVMKSM